MVNLIFVGLAAMIYLDILVFKRQDRKSFERVFSLPKAITIFVSSMFLLLFLGASHKEGMLFFFFTAFFLPFYLLRRCQLVQILEADGRRSAFMPEPLDEKARRTLFSDALGVTINWIFGSAIISFFTESILNLVFEGPVELAQLGITAVLSSILAILLIYKAVQKFSNRGFFQNIAFIGADYSLGKVIFLPALVGFIFAALSAGILTARQVQPPTPLGEIIDTTNSPLILLSFLGIAVFFAPLSEEIIFRGYFFYVFSKVRSQRFAIYFIALIFGFLHVGQYWGDWMAITMVLLLGFILTIFRAWTGSTLSSTVIHYVYNGGITVIPILFLMFSNPSYFKYQIYYPYYDPVKKEQLLKDSIQRQSQFMDAYNDLAWLYAEEDKNLETALNLIDQALAVHPEHAAYLDTKAEILYKLGRWEEAFAIRKRLLEKGLSKEMKEYQQKKIEEIRESLNFDSDTQLDRKLP